MTPERYQKLCATLDRRQPDLTVITDGVHKPHNIAAIVRTCDAVGIQQVYASLPDNAARASAKSAMGSQKWVDVVQRDSALEAMTTLQSEGYQVLAAHFSDRAVPYREVDFTRPTALLLGTEKFGVSPAAADAADEHVIIPMMGMVASFNVSVATAIILAEACEQRRRAGLYDKPRLKQERYRELLMRWGHPRVVALCEERGLPWPELDDEGQIPVGALRNLEEREG
jgi:tRNA (guanosine-2'-O-)-methyltransferase